MDGRPHRSPPPLRVSCLIGFHGSSVAISIFSVVLRQDPVSLGVHSRVTEHKVWESQPLGYLHNVVELALRDGRALVHQRNVVPRRELIVVVVEEDPVRRDARYALRPRQDLVKEDAKVFFFDSNQFQTHSAKCNKLVLFLMIYYISEDVRRTSLALNWTVVLVPRFWRKSDAPSLRGDDNQLQFGGDGPLLPRHAWSPRQRHMSLSLSFQVNKDRPE